MAAAMATHNAHQVTVALEAHGEEIERELARELERIAREATRDVRGRAPKWRSELVNSISATQPQPLVWEIRPGVEHGLYREKGQPPGKHLPRFFDPNAKPIVDWVASKAFHGLARVRQGTKRFTARELELRDRYMALSWHVFHKGLKPQPHFEPVAQALRDSAPARLAAVVERLVRQANELGGEGAPA